MQHTTALLSVAHFYLVPGVLNQTDIPALYFNTGYGNIVGAYIQAGALEMCLEEETAPMGVDHHQGWF